MNNIMKTYKKKSLFLNRLPTGCTLIGFSLLLLISYLVLPVNVNAAVDVDTSGDGRAAAFDGEEGIATDGDSFCSITNDIAGGKFSSLFEGIVGDCDNSNSQSLNQFLVEYSYTKNPVKIGEKTYLTMTVKDKETGKPVSNAAVTLAFDHSPSSLEDDTGSTAFAAAAAGVSSSQDAAVEDRITQTMHTDNNGRATFTVQLGPKSDIGIYDTDIEVSKDRYQSIFKQTDLHVI